MSPKLNVVHMNRYIKTKSILSIAKRKNTVINELLLYDLISAALEGRSPDEEPIESIKKIDLTQIFIACPGLNQRFKCSFFSDRTAWIHKIDNGHYRYYSRKNSMKCKSVYSFDILDLLEIIRNDNRKDVLSFIQKRWGLTGLTGWYSEQTEKHQYNQLVLEFLKNDSKQFPNLNKLLEKHWSFLEVINSYSLRNLVGEQYAVDKEAIFFLSNKYLNETYFPESSISTINGLINLLCVLGFMRKVPIDKLPIKMAEKAELQLKLMRVKNQTSFYSILNFQGVLEEAERRAKMLVNENIYYHRLTKKVVSQLFGEDFCSRIYVQKTAGKRGKAEPIYFKGEDQTYTETERLEQLFLHSIQTTGKCEKSFLSKSTLLPPLRFDTTWKQIVRKHQCKEKYPTQIEMKRFNMEKRYLIAVPLDL